VVLDFYLFVVVFVFGDVVGEVEVFEWVVFCVDCELVVVGVLRYIVWECLGC